MGTFASGSNSGIRRDVSDSRVQSSDKSIGINKQQMYQLIVEAVFLRGTRKSQLVGYNGSWVFYPRGLEEPMVCQV